MVRFLGREPGGAAAIDAVASTNKQKQDPPGRKRQKHVSIPWKNAFFQEPLASDDNLSVKVRSGIDQTNQKLKNYNDSDDDTASVFLSESLVDMDDMGSIATNHLKDHHQHHHHGGKAASKKHHGKDIKMVVEVDIIPQDVRDETMSPNPTKTKNQHSSTAPESPRCSPAPRSPAGSLPPHSPTTPRHAATTTSAAQASAPPLLPNLAGLGQVFSSGNHMSNDNDKGDNNANNDGMKATKTKLDQAFQRDANQEPRLVSSSASNSPVSTKTDNNNKNNDKKNHHSPSPLQRRKQHQHQQPKPRLAGFGQVITKNEPKHFIHQEIPQQQQQQAIDPPAANEATIPSNNNVVLAQKDEEVPTAAASTPQPQPPSNLAQYSLGYQVSLSENHRHSLTDDSDEDIVDDNDNDAVQEVDRDMASSIGDESSCAFQCIPGHEDDDNPFYITTTDEDSSSAGEASSMEGASSMETETLSTIMEEKTNTMDCGSVGGRSTIYKTVSTAMEDGNASTWGYHTDGDGDTDRDMDNDKEEEEFILGVPPPLSPPPSDSHSKNVPRSLTANTTMSTTNLDNNNSSRIQTIDDRNQSNMLKEAPSFLFHQEGEDQEEQGQEVIDWSTMRKMNMGWSHFTQYWSDQEVATSSSNNNNNNHDEQEESSSLISTLSSRQPQAHSFDNPFFQSLRNMNKFIFGAPTLTASSNDVKARDVEGATAADIVKSPFGSGRGGTDVDEEAGHDFMRRHSFAAFTGPEQEYLEHSIEKEQLQQTPRPYGAMLVVAAIILLIIAILIRL